MPALDALAATPTTAPMTTTDRSPTAPRASVIRDRAAMRRLWIGGSVWLTAAVSMPWWGDASLMRDFVEMSCFFIFAMMWNLLAGYGGMVSVGQQGLLRSGWLCDGGAGQPGRRQRISGGAAGCAGGRLSGGTGVVAGVSPAGGVLRDRHLGHRRGVPPHRGQHRRGRRRLGHQPDGAARRGPRHARRTSPMHWHSRPWW